MSRRDCCRRAKAALYNLLVASSRPTTRLLQAPIIPQEYANRQHLLTPPPRCIANLSSSSLIAAAAALKKPVKSARIIGNNAYRQLTTAVAAAAANPVLPAVVTPFWQRKRTRLLPLRLLLRLSILALASTCVGFVGWRVIAMGEEETVPYTKRRRYVSVPHVKEQPLGDRGFQRRKKSYGEKVLPQDHPDSVRVSLITRRIVEALQRGITQQTVWSSSSSSCCFDSERDYLQGLNWEVMVVDSTDHSHAISISGGKIVVFTGLLKHSVTDVEIATIVGHEVGHVVARHSAERVKWRLVINCIILELVFATVALVGFSKFALMPGLLFCAASNYLYHRLLSQRMESEADYIGLLLIASAGYDPRLAPKVYAELSHDDAASSLKAYCGSHPNGKKRARLLAQPQVMEEAMAIYNQVGSIPPLLQQDLGDSNSGASTTETKT